MGTIFAQAAQRYIAKITLAAHMPGNGMGGSTRPDQVITTPAANPTKGYWTGTANWGIWKAADKAQATACGGGATQIPQTAAKTGTLFGIANTVDTPVTSTVSLKMNGGLACSKMASGAGTAASNTATFRTLQPVVSQIGSMGTGANADNGALGAAGAAVATPTPA